MNKHLKKLIDDVKKGENIDLYLAIVLAIVLTTLLHISAMMNGDFGFIVNALSLHREHSFGSS